MALQGLAKRIESTKAHAVDLGMDMVSPLANRSDDDLIAAMAEHRDAEAFTELFKRHEHAAYSLALHITGRPDLAEEAVQEAALGLWLSARRYRSGSVARAWLLGIVAGKSLEILRARRARKRTRESAPLAEGVCAAMQAEDPLEKHESLSALRRALEGLPQLERQLLALHFGGGLSHEEIGTALAMPRRTISYRLEQAVQALRAELVQAGFGALAPLLGAEGLHQALTSGVEPPAGLCERVSKGLTYAARESLRASRPIAITGAWGRALLALGLAAGAAVGAFFVASREPAGPVPDPSATPQPALEPAPDAPAAAAAQGKIQARWTFDQGPAEDLKVLEGEWRWVPVQAGRPAGMAVADAAAYIALPMQIPEGKCLEITTQTCVTAAPSEWSSMSAVWNISGHRQKTLSWGKPFPLKPADFCSCRTFLSEKWEVSTFWRSPSQFLDAHVLEYEAPVVRHPNALLRLKNIIVQEIQIRELLWEEVPRRFRDPKKLIAELKLASLDRRNVIAPAGSRPDMQKTK